MTKVYWLSRHELSPGQIQAIRDLHGADVHVEKVPAVFQDTEGLTDFIRTHPEGFCYAVAGAAHYLHAALGGCRFGVFENHPQKRQDGIFGLAAVYHVVDRLLKMVWRNPNPMSDVGEALIPIAL